MSEFKPEPGWLQKQIDAATAKVAAWPEWKRERFRQAFAPPAPDPCKRRRACDEAQTCVGGCVYDRRTSP